MNTEFQFSVSYCYPIDDSEDWRRRHTFKIWHCRQIKSITRNEHKRFRVVLVTDEAPGESYTIREHCFGNRDASAETLAQYCTREGNEYTFPDVQCPEFGCQI